MAFELNRAVVFGVCIVCLAIACFSLGIYALVTGVDYFSALFRLTDEAAARTYLNANYNGILDET